MEKIDNLFILEKELLLENPNWKKEIYNKLGVLVIPDKDYWTLYSNCGELDLDYDVEYVYSDNEDRTLKCEVHSIKELEDYIIRMPGYNLILEDVSLGKTSKSSAFWGIYSCILKHNLYDGDINNQVYGLKRIIGPEDGYITFDASICGVDEIGSMIYKINENTTLHDIVNFFVEELKQLDYPSQDEEVPTFMYNLDESIIIPNNFDELMQMKDLIQY